MNHEIEQLQHFLASTDSPCPSCDYNLRGLKSDACPECNQKLVLNVALAEPRQRAFIAALVGLAMGAGFQGLLALYFLYWTLIRNKGMGGDGRHFTLLTAPFFVVEGAALLLLVYKRRPFQRRSNRFKACCVTAAWFVTISGFAIFTALIK